MSKIIEAARASLSCLDDALEARVEIRWIDE